MITLRRKKLFDSEATLLSAANGVDDLMALSRNAVDTTVGIVRSFSNDASEATTNFLRNGVVHFPEADAVVRSSHSLDDSAIMASTTDEIECTRSAGGFFEQFRRHHAASNQSTACELAQSRAQELLARYEAGGDNDKVDDATELEMQPENENDGRIDREGSKDALILPSTSRRPLLLHQHNIGSQQERLSRPPAAPALVTKPRHWQRSEDAAASRKAHMASAMPLSHLASQRQQEQLSSYYAAAFDWSSSSSTSIC